ncbi:MAG TPA: DUF2202 domain-containing protein [Eubacteriales bacterium]|nr:DUF2202 domain-containing protein [Eubacteriales bacterium]
MKRKWNKKWLIVILTLTVLALIATGCTLATEGETAAGYQGGRGEAAADNGYDGDCIATEDETYANYNGNGSFETAEVGAGYRGGNGGDATGSYSDDCLLPESETPAADSSYTLSAEDTVTSLTGYGAAGALSDADLTLADMLTYALQDEYLAHAEYTYIIDTYGSIRPFTNIIRAEETHIETLLPLFETYGITAPADDASSRIAKVASLTEAYEAGVEAEIDNIAMYEAFLSEDLPSDVRVVFESLMSASESHLKAFENKL